MIAKSHARRMFAALLCSTAVAVASPLLRAAQADAPGSQEATGLPGLPLSGAVTPQVAEPAKPAAESVLLVAGQEIYRMRASLGPFSPAERAEAARLRIRAIIGLPEFDAEDIKVAELDGQIRILDKDLTLFTVLPADYPEEAHANLASEADRVARSLAAAIQVDRAARTPRQLAIASGLTVLVIVLLIVLGRLLLRAFRWLKPRIEAGKGTVLRGLQFRGLELISADATVAGALKLADLARAASLLLLGYVSVSIVLALFPWTQPYGRASASFVLSALGRVVRGFIAFIPNLFMITLIIIVVRYINRFVSFIFDAVSRGALVIPFRRADGLIRFGRRHRQSGGGTRADLHARVFGR